LEDTVFDGEILQVNTYNDRLGSSFTANINRANLDLPGDVTYFIQVANDYFMAMSLENNFTTTNNLIESQILNFQSETTDIDHVSAISLTGVLKDEYGTPMADTDVKFQFDTQNTTDDIDLAVWEDLMSISAINTATTNENGEFEFDLNLSQTPLGGNVLLQAQFLGNSSHALTKTNLSLAINEYDNQLSVNLDTSKTLIRGTHNIISGTITNGGNSSVTDIIVHLSNSQFQGEVIFSEADKDRILLPGEQIEFQIDFYDKQFSEYLAVVQLEVNGTVVETDEQYVSSLDFDFNTYRNNDSAVNRNMVLIGFIGGVALIWMFTAKFVKGKIDEINAPLETLADDKNIKSKRRTSKYVNLSDLNRQKGPTPDPEMKKDTEGTTLDDLLDKS